MRKKLRLDDLAVESFEAGGPTPARGTGRAHQSDGAECTFGCSIENQTCACATLRWQLDCAEETNASCFLCA